MITAGAVAAAGLVAAYFSTTAGALSRFFSWNDFDRSETALNYGISQQFHAPRKAKRAGQKLARLVLDPIAEYLTGSVKINSWYRSPELNAMLIALGYAASANSTHLTGGTADVSYYENGIRDNGMIMRAILAQRLPFDRALLEFDTIDNPRWIQIEYDAKKLPAQQRGIILYTPDGHSWEQVPIEQAELLFM